MMPKKPQSRSKIKREAYYENKTYDFLRDEMRTLIFEDLIEFEQKIVNYLNDIKRNSRDESGLESSASPGYKYYFTH